MRRTNRTFFNSLPNPISNLTGIAKIGHPVSNSELTLVIKLSNVKFHFSIRFKMSPWAFASPRSQGRPAAKTCVPPLRKRLRIYRES